MSELTWDPAALPVVVLLVAATVLYSIKHYVLAAARFQARLEDKGVPPAEAQTYGVLLRRVSAGALLGIGMVVAEALAGIELIGEGVRTPPGLSTAACLAGALAVLGPILWASGRTASVQANQPEVRAPVQPPDMVLRGWIAWAIYLLGYEYLFRGALLFGLAATLGAWPALAITTALYALVHLPKPMLGETLGSVAMGFVFGAMALGTGAIWAPWLLHLGIVVITETSSGRANPTIRWWVRES